MSTNDYEAYLEQLAVRRAPALAKANQLVLQDQLQEAEAEVLRVDSSIYGAVELSRLFSARLQSLVNDGEATRDRARVLRVYERALHWATSAFPEPHTEIEAENYERGRVEAAARLRGVLGFDPHRIPEATSPPTAPAQGAKRMSIGLAILAVLTMLASLLVGVTAVVLILASGANSSPAQITMLKRMMLAVGVLCVGCIGGSIFALVPGRAGLARVVGMTPSVVIGLTLIVLIAIGA